MHAQIHEYLKLVLTCYSGFSLALKILLYLHPGFSLLFYFLFSVIICCQPPRTILRSSVLLQECIIEVMNVVTSLAPFLSRTSTKSGTSLAASPEAAREICSMSSCVPSSDRSCSRRRSIAMRRTQHHSRQSCSVARWLKPEHFSCRQSISQWFLFLPS